MLKKTKDIGIIGGAGPQAGVALTKKVIQICQEKYSCKRDEDFPYISLISFPFSEMLREHDHTQIEKQLNSLIQTECPQFTYWAIACNTLHCYLESKKMPNTFVHLINECKTELKEKPIVFCSSTSKINKIHQSFFDCEYPDEIIQVQLDKLIDELVANEPTGAHYSSFKLILTSTSGLSPCK